MYQSANYDDSDRYERYEEDCVPTRDGRCKFLPQIPLDQYRLNEDPNPEVIKKRPTEKIHYTQEIAVRYLNPPQPPKPGDIVVKQLPNRQIAPAPPLVVRQKGERALTPPPIVIREAPPQPPPQIPPRSYTVPGKVIPPPARKVILEKLPPIPPKPQSVLIERWLPYKPQKARVVYQKSQDDCVLPDPKNVLIQWEQPDVEVSKEFRNLGVHNADPNDYVRRYGAELVTHDRLPSIAANVPAPQGFELAANYRHTNETMYEGDVEALRLVNLNGGNVNINNIESNYSTNRQHHHHHHHQQHQQQPRQIIHNNNYSNIRYNDEIRHRPEIHHRANYETRYEEDDEEYDDEPNVQSVYGNYTRRYASPIPEPHHITNSYDNYSTRYASNGNYNGRYAVAPVQYGSSC